MDFCSVMTFPSCSYVFQNDLLCLWIPLSREDNTAKSEPIRQTGANESISHRGALQVRAHQERLGDDILHYFQVMLHGFVFGVGALHLLIRKETEQQGLVLEFTLFQH